MQWWHLARGNTPSQHVTDPDLLLSALAAAGHRQVHRAAGAMLMPLCVVELALTLCDDRLLLHGTNVDCLVIAVMYCSLPDCTCSAIQPSCEWASPAMVQ